MIDVLCGIHGILGIGSPIQGLAKGARSQGGSIQGGRGTRAPSFRSDLIDTLVPQKATGSSTPTFTRATTATFPDFESILRTAIAGEPRFSGARRVRNLVPNTVDLSTAYIKVNTTVAGGVDDPDGGTNASTITYTGPGDWYVLVGGGTFPVGNKYTQSYYIRRRTGTGSVWSIDNSVANRTDITAAITSAWRLVAVVGTSGAGVTNAYLGLESLTAGDAFDVYFPQLEDVTGQTNEAPSERISVGVLSAPYHGAGNDGTKYFRYQNGNTVASNVVTEAQGAAIADATLKRYLREEARTNRLLQCCEFDEAVWVSGGGGVAVDDQSTAGPDGATTADTLTASGANGTLIQDLGVVGSAAKAGSIYLKRKTGTGDIDLTMDGGSTWTTVAVTSSWARFDVDQTIADEDFGIRIVTSGDAVYAAYGQVETGAYATSPIATTTVAVTRNADVLTYPQAGNQSDTAGTAFAECTPTDWTNGTGQTIGDGTEYLLAPKSDQSGVQSYDGTNTVTGAAGAPSGTVKQAAKWSGSALTAYADGVAGAPGSYDGAFSLASIGIGAGAFCGNIGNVRLWASALTDQQIAGL